MSNMVLIDAHIHSMTISRCSHVPPENLVRICLADGLSGIVLTNHFKHAHMKPNTSYEEYRQEFLDSYYETKKWGDKLGLKVFFGIEFTLDQMTQNDFTVYGLTPKDIEEMECPFTWPLETLSEYAHSKGALIYHAHPYRNTVPVDPTLVDGTEINCHPYYGMTFEEKVREHAAKHNLRLLCGSDYHGDTYFPHCGTLIPSEIESDAELLEYFKKTYLPEMITVRDRRKDEAFTLGIGVEPISWEQRPELRREIEFLMPDKK